MLIRVGTPGMSRAALNKRNIPIAVQELASRVPKMS